MGDDLRKYVEAARQSVKARDALRIWSIDAAEAELERFYKKLEQVWRAAPEFSDVGFTPASYNRASVPDDMAVREDDEFWFARQDTPCWLPHIGYIPHRQIAYNPFTKHWSCSGTATFSEAAVLDDFKKQLAHWIVHEYPSWKKRRSEELALNATSTEEQTQSGCIIAVIALMAAPLLILGAGVLRVT